MEPILKAPSSSPPIMVPAAAAPGESAFAPRAAEGEREGEMARRVREFDWAKTPLGPPERWSPALKWAVGLVLASGFPKAVRWGPELILIYNYAYRPILGDNHPAGRGKPPRDARTELYGQLRAHNQ